MWWAVVAGAYQPQADCPGLPGAGGGGGQGEQLGEGQQVTGQGHVQASDTVLREALQGEVVEPGVFCAADAVPWRRARSRWRALRSASCPTLVLGGEGGGPVVPDVLEAQLGALVGPVSAHG